MNESPTSWGQLISIAKQSGVFAQESKERVMSWQTCAVGELSRTLGPYQTLRVGGLAQRKCRTPADPTLMIFGRLFAFAVNNDDPYLAWICWKGIYLFLEDFREASRKVLSRLQEKLEVTYVS